MKHVANTIDEKHTELLNDFHHDRTVIIPGIKVQICEKKKRLLESNNVEDYMDIKDDIEKLQKKLQENVPHLASC